MTDFEDQPSAVRDGEEIDVTRLEAWLRGRIAHTSGGVTVAQFARGYSNLTYLIRAGERELVLRRSPPGVKIKSAHDMGREFRVLSHLANVWSKSPRPVAYEEDESVIGTPFYLMERVYGIVLRARAPHGLILDEAAMRRVSEAVVDTLAEIHLVDWRAAGLADLGKPEGYVERQLAGWTARYRKAQTDDVREIELVREWLFAEQPPEDAAALIHNDFKYDNLVFDAGLTRVVAVLDWEMATVGHPWMDLGTTLGYWVEARDPPVFQTMAFGPTALLGNLSRAELVRRYEARTKRPVERLLFTYVFALYKMAIVAQQLYRRYVDGATRDGRYATMLEGARAVSASALVAIEKARIDRLGEP